MVVGLLVGLQELGVVWEVFEQEWDKYLREIEKYIKTSGNNVVPGVFLLLATIMLMFQSFREAQSSQE